MAGPAKREPRRFGLGSIIITVGLATAVFALLGALTAHLLH